MIHDPLVRLRSLFKHPLLAAYAMVAGLVLLGRELDMLRQTISGGLPPNAGKTFAYLVDTSVANILISAVWPSYFIATANTTWFLGALCTYVVLLALFFQAERSGA